MCLSKKEMVFINHFNSGRTLENKVGRVLISSIGNDWIVKSVRYMPEWSQAIGKSQKGKLFWKKSFED